MTLLNFILSLFGIVEIPEQKGQIWRKKSRPKGLVYSQQIKRVTMAKNVTRAYYRFNIKPTSNEMD